MYRLPHILFQCDWQSSNMDSVCVCWGWVSACLHPPTQSINFGTWSPCCKEAKVRDPAWTEPRREQLRPQLTSSWTPKQLGRKPSDFRQQPFKWGLKGSRVRWVSAVPVWKLITHQIWKQNKLFTPLDSGEFVLQPVIETWKSKFTLKTTTA